MLFECKNGLTKTLAFKEGIFMFGRKKQPVVPTSDPQRDKLFAALESRHGKEVADILREDFDVHLEQDGIDAAYVCLCSKLISSLDTMEAMVGKRYGNSGNNNPPPPSGFTGFEFAMK
jgi:hypothetical protein